MAPHLKGPLFCLLAGLLAVPLNCATQADCVEICTRYSACITNIDVTECADACEDRADADERIQEAAQNCEECLERGSCPETTQCFEPGMECPLAIVPAPEGVDE